MNFIYDILLNFNDKELYEFYEWSKDDCVDYVKTILLFRLNDTDFYQIRDNDVIIDKEFLNMIYQSCEVVKQKSIKTLDYVCLFTNLKEVYAVMFNEKGESLMKSGMLLDESYEVMERGERLKILSINYKIINKREKIKYLTRKEKDIIYFLNKEINNIYKNKNIEKIKYLYFECFNKIENNIDFIYKNLKKLINGEWSNKHLELYHLVKLSYMKK